MASLFLFMFGIKIVIMGDSAGGNLAAVITQRRKVRGEQQFAGQVLMYPLLQMADLQSVSYRYYQKNLEGFALVGQCLVR